MGQTFSYLESHGTGEKDEDKHRMVGQLVQLHKSYTDGLLGYLRNAKQLLLDSQEGIFA